MKSIEELKLILPDAKETQKVSSTFKAILKEREKTKEPRLVYIEKCLVLIKEQVEIASLKGEESIVFKMPEKEQGLDGFSVWLDLQGFLHNAGYSAKISVGNNDMVISWASRF